MALRVLLADESSTIKKVMMLALQDFAVEVKSVPVGLDVVAVAKTYKPDIIFADVLLTKRNGYEVTGDLKKDPETSSIPVVLMWSGFMELDEVKASECHADRRLEKPFDADTLRGLVHDLVKKTRSNPLSEYLTFPQMPEFDEPAAPTPQVGASTPPSAAVRENTAGDIYTIPEEASEEILADFPEEHDVLDMPQGEEFSQVPLSGTPKIMRQASEEGGWSHQDLSKFKIQIPPSEIEQDDFASKFVIPQDELSHAHVQVSGNFEEISFEPPTKSRSASVQASPQLEQRPPPSSLRQETITTIRPEPRKEAESRSELRTEPRAESVTNIRVQTPADRSVKAQSGVDMNSDMMEKIIREQARELIESICWKVLPDMAERIVREEIQKMLADT